MSTKTTIILTLVVAAIGLLMATPFHAIGVALDGDRGGNVGVTVWKLAMVVGGLAYLSYIRASRRRASNRGTGRSTGDAHDPDALAVIPQEDV